MTLMSYNKTFSNVMYSHVFDYYPEIDLLTFTEHYILKIVLKNIVQMHCLETNIGKGFSLLDNE